MTDGPRPLPSPVAIDGPAAAGKTTIAAALAAEFGYAVLDTGMTYRAFTYEAIRRGVSDGDRAGCAKLAASIDLVVAGGAIAVGGEDVTQHLRTPAVERRVSAYSALPAVRTAMVRIQREAGLRQPTIVVGRDIGTVVFPKAPLKLFLTATTEERARRRSRQAGHWGVLQGVDEAGADIQHRDSIDSSRQVSPTRAAADAVVIDTSKLSLDDVIEEAKRLVRAWIA
jgi:cytidylate kinase